MILYNWKKLYQKTKGNKDLIIRFFRFITFPKDYNYSLYKNLYIKEVLQSKEKNEYLLNNKDFVMNYLRASKDEQYYYLLLSSLRNYSDYKIKGVKYLDADILKLCNFDFDKINRNKLLNLDNNRIYFIYEENI